MSLVTSLDQLDQALTIARKHGATQIKIDTVEVFLGLPPETKPDRQIDPDLPVPKNIDAEAYSAYKNL